MQGHAEGARGLVKLLNHSDSKSLTTALLTLYSQHIQHQYYIFYYYFYYYYIHVPEFRGHVKKRRY